MHCASHEAYHLLSSIIHHVSTYQFKTFPCCQVVLEMEERLMKPLVLDRKTGREGKVKFSGGTFVQLKGEDIEDLIRQKRQHEANGKGQGGGAAA